MKALLIICLIFQTFTSYSQEEIAARHNIKIGLGFSYFPVTGVKRFLGRDEDVPEIHGKEFYSAGITSVYSFKKNLAIESGAMFSKFLVEVAPRDYDQPKYMEDISILYIPLSLRYNFNKFAYITSGLLFEFDISEPGEFQNQSGIGIMLCPGFSFEFLNKISVFFNPYLKNYFQKNRVIYNMSSEQSKVVQRSTSPSSHSLTQYALFGLR